MHNQEQIKFWHDASLSNLELLHATYVTHTFAPHTHEGYVIGVVEQGAEQFQYRRSKHIAPTGSIVLINPGEMHTGSSATENGWTYRTFYPSTGLLQQAASQFADHQRAMPFFAEPVVYDPDLMREISLTHRALEEGVSALERESRLLWTLTRLIARHADDRPHPLALKRENVGIQRARLYIEDHYAENISLQELAAIAQLSPFHLLRSFRNQVNLPPHAYQLQVRIMHARHLLRVGTSAVDTALSIGFADQSHFSKHFKRVVGVSPGQYSAGHRK